MADPKKSSIASQFSGLPMKALIGAPLKAATDANAMIAKSQTDFILEYCFEYENADAAESDLKSAKRRPVMIPFRLERQMVDSNTGEDLGKTSMEFSVPLLTLVPINSLAVETLKINFDMEVKSSREFRRETSDDRQARKKETSTNSDGASGSANKKITKSYQPHEFDTELHGTLSSKSSDQKSKDSVASYEVTLTAGQLPLPRGVTAILDIFTKNLTPMPVNKESKDQE